MTSLIPLQGAPDGWWTIFEGISVIDILKAGFLGFSFLVLFLSFQLMSTLVKTQGMPVENLREKMRAVIAYILLGFFSICAALFFFWLDQGRTVEVTIEKFPSVRQQIREVPLKDAAGEYVPFEERTHLAVRQGDRITIYMDDLDEFIEDLEELVVRLNEEITGLRNTQRAVTDAIVEPPSTAPGDEGGI